MTEQNEHQDNSNEDQNNQPQTTTEENQSSNKKNSGMKTWQKVSLGIIAGMVVMGIVANLGESQKTNETSTSSKETVVEDKKEETKSTAKETATVQTPVKETFISVLQGLGDFEPVTISGTGDDVRDMPVIFPSIITIWNGGSSNFSVTLLGESGKSVDLLVNEIGQYDGTVTTFNNWQKAKLIEIKSSGDWSMTLTPLSHMAQAINGASYYGDNVVFIDEDTISKISFTHTGTSNFAVKAIGRTSSKLLVNEIGAYNGTVAWSEPGAFFIVTADGDWTISW